jgi:NAD-reducing hydrogenase large subunit
VLLRRFGQEVIRLTAGKRVHGTGSIPGGVNRQLTTTERDELRAGLPQIIDWCESAIDLVGQLRARDPAGFDGFATMRSSWLSMVRPDGTLDLYDGVLRWKDAEGAILRDGVDVQAYGEHIEEATEPWTYLKFPYLRTLGRADGWYRVGPLARLQVCDRLSTWRAEARRQAFVAGGPVHGSLAYHAARMIEMLHAAEVIGELLDDESVVAGDLAAPVVAGDGPREGVGVIEAPRGTLIHHYRIGPDDLVTDCNLIVSTTHNNEAMNEAVRTVAREELSGREITEPLLARIETAVRAYDPCLSCATHALGQMPLVVTLETGAGAVVDRVVRDGDGHLRRA